MAKRRRTVGLIAFLKGDTDPRAGMPGCPNYDKHYGGCLFGDKCSVQEGSRCGYFERVVFANSSGHRPERIGLFVIREARWRRGAVLNRRNQKVSGVQKRSLGRDSDTVIDVRKDAQGILTGAQERERLVDAQQLTKFAPQILHSKRCFEAV